MFGFGVVGQGLYDIIKTKNLNLEIKKFVIKNADKKTYATSRSVFNRS